MSIYLPAARIALFVGHRQLAAMLVRTWLEMTINSHALAGEKRWQTLHRLVETERIDRPTRNALRAAYDSCSRAIHGRPTKSRTIKRAITTVKKLT